MKMSDSKKTGTEEHQELMPLGDVNLADRDVINQMIGRHQMANSIAKIATVASLLDLQKIKENKLYKGLSDIQSGDGAKKMDWATFCEMIGTSRRTVDEQLQNLKVFGPEAIEGINTMGVGVRQLRQLRKLPEDDLEQAKELAKENDKDSLLGLIEDQAVEKANLKEDLNTANETNEKLNNETITLQEKVDALKDQLEMPVAGSDVHPWCALLRKEVPVLAEEANADLLSIEALSQNYLDMADLAGDKATMYKNSAVIPALAQVASIARNALSLFERMSQAHDVMPEDIAVFTVPMEAAELEEINVAVGKMLSKRQARAIEREDSYRRSKAIKFAAGRPSKPA